MANTSTWVTACKTSKCTLQTCCLTEGCLPSLTTAALPALGTAGIAHRGPVTPTAWSTMSFNNQVKSQKYIGDKRRNVPLNVPPSPTLPKSYSISSGAVVCPLQHPHVSGIRAAAPPVSKANVTPEEIPALCLKLLSSVALQPCCIFASQQWRCCCWNIPCHASCWASLNGINSLLRLSKPRAIHRCPFPFPTHNKHICSSSSPPSLPPSPAQLHTNKLSKGQASLPGQCFGHRVVQTDQGRHPNSSPGIWLQISIAKEQRELEIWQMPSNWPVFPQCTQCLKWMADFIIWSSFKDSGLPCFVLILQTHFQEAHSYGSGWHYGDFF